MGEIYSAEETYKFIKAGSECNAEILAFYRELIGTKGCTWDEGYPNEETVKKDTQSSSLFLLTGESGEIIATATIEEYAGFWDEISWKKCKNPCALARLGVKKGLHGQGIGVQMMTHILENIKGRGFDSVCLLVAEDNDAAITLYKKFGFEFICESCIYDTLWQAYQLTI